MALAGTEHHPHARTVLNAALPPEGAPSHAYLFHGPAGAGKREAARAFAAVLLADGAADPASARERVLSGAHPDLTWVTPSGAHELLVDDIQEPVVAAATRTPFEARRRVFVIEQADTMNDIAANKMLKTLEEPASYVHLILLTDRPSEMLPTIASRCQAVRFDALPVEEIARRLETRGIQPDQALACAGLALGDAGLALALALGDGPALRAAAERFSSAAVTGEMESAPWKAFVGAAKKRGEAIEAQLDEAFEAQRETFAKSERKKRETAHRDRVKRARRREETKALDLTLQLAGLWFRDLACVAWGAPELAHNADRREALAAQAAGRSPARLRRAVDEVEETRRRLRLNVTEELACEALGYRLEALLA